MANYVELTIEQGATFNTTVTVTSDTGDVLDLAGYTCQAQMRKSYYSVSATTFVTDIPDPTAGELLISLDAETTATLTPGRYVYDVILIDPSDVVTRVFEGTIAVTPGVTRNE